MSSIFELAAEYEILLEMAMDPEVDAELISDTMEGINGEIELKANNYARVIDELKGKANTVDAEIKRLSVKKEAIENNIKRIKENLENAMLTTGKTKFETDLYKFNIQKNPAKLVFREGVCIPVNWYKTPEPQVDKARIKEALKNGTKLDFAELVQTESLRIR